MGLMVVVETKHLIVPVNSYPPPRRGQDALNSGAAVVPLLLARRHDKEEEDLLPAMLLPPVLNIISDNAEAKIDQKKGLVFFSKSFSSSNITIRDLLFSCTTISRYIKDTH